LQLLSAYKEDKDTTDYPDPRRSPDYRLHQDKSLTGFDSLQILAVTQPGTVRWPQQTLKR
jgi:hypothetical protein